MEDFASNPDFSSGPGGGDTVNSPAGGASFDFSSFFRNLMSGGGGEGGMLQLLPMILKGLMSSGGAGPGTSAGSQGGQNQQPMAGGPQQQPQGQQQNPLAIQALNSNLQSRGLYSGGIIDPSTVQALGLQGSTPPKGPGQSYSPFFTQQLAGLGY